MGAQHEEAVGTRVGGFDEVEQIGEVAEALGHLLATDLDEPVMHPMTSKGSPGGHGLGPFVLMVGEGEILTAAVQIETVAEQIKRHDNTFGVPAWSTITPWGWP